MTTDPYKWDVAPNPTSIDIGDGAGGIARTSIPYYGNSGRQGADNSDYAMHQIMLALLVAAWSATVAKGNGTTSSGGSGSGNGFIGIA